MKRVLWIGLVIFVVAFSGLFSTISSDEEVLYRSPESRYAMAMTTQDIVDELYMTVIEIERVQKDKEKVRELSEDILFYTNILEQKGEDVSIYCTD